MFASFNRFELQMTKNEAESVSHSGDCQLDVIELLKSPKIKRQLKKITDEQLATELREYGAWDDEQLKNREENEERIVWIAGCNISEELYMKKRN